MRKRINSNEKSSYGQIKTVAIGLNKQALVEKSKQPNRCPPLPPKPQFQHTNTRCRWEKQVSSLVIKKFPNALMKELRRLVINQIDSGDRLFRSLISQQHKAALKLYIEDRTKLIQYMNSLAIREVNIDSIKLSFQNSDGSFKSGDDKITSLERSLREHDKTRKRCKSEQGKTNDALNLQIKQVKKKLKEFQKQWKQSSKNRRSPKLSNQKSIDEVDNSNSENLIIDVKNRLQASINQNLFKDEFVIMEKYQIEILIRKISEHIKKISCLNTELQHQKQQTQKYRLLSEQLRKQLDEALNQKELLQKKHAGQKYDELRDKVNKLYEELGQLVSQLQNKDQIIQYLKLQNENQRKDLYGLQDMNRQIREQQKIMSEYLQNLQRRLKCTEEELAHRQQQILEQRILIAKRDHELIQQGKQLQAVLRQVQTIKEDYQSQIKGLNLKITTESQDKALLILQRDELKTQNQNHQAKIKKMEQQYLQLQKNVEKAISQQSITSMNIQYLKEHLQSVKEQNILLARQLDEQSSFRKATKMYYPQEHPSQNLVEKQNIQMPKSIRNLSMQVQHSNSGYLQDIGSLDASIVTPLKIKSQSINNKLQFLTDRMRNQNNIEKTPPSSKCKIKRKSGHHRLDQLQDAYECDDERGNASQKNNQGIQKNDKVLEEYKKDFQDNQKFKIIQIKQQLVTVHQQGNPKESSQWLTCLNATEAPQDTNSKQSSKPLSLCDEYTPHKQEESIKRSSKNIQNGQESSGINSHQSKISKNSKSSNRNIFIKWSAKKIDNSPKKLDRGKSCQKDN